ncbi:hypothetical protein C8J32_102680 [Rhizobium sp. PP-CC-3A-592]|nr:hypothetical protein C8J32_102680 [Rhizobium sp. PP-CC-3A-592]
MTMNVRTVEVVIERDAGAVYAYASRPETMPLWASGLASGLQPAGDHWVASGPLGTVRIFFTPANDLGVMDHTVVEETGVTSYNAFRVTPNGSGAVVVFTLLQPADTSEDSFARDVAWVQKDLTRLKALLEGEGDATA